MVDAGWDQILAVSARQFGASATGMRLRLLCRAGRQGSDPSTSQPDARYDAARVSGGLTKSRDFLTQVDQRLFRSLVMPTHAATELKGVTS